MRKATVLGGAGAPYLIPGIVTLGAAVIVIGLMLSESRRDKSP